MRAVGGGSGEVDAEAVGLVQELSSEGSPAFVNGLLARIAEVIPTLAAD